MYYKAGLQTFCSAGIGASNFFFTLIHFKHHLLIANRNNGADFPLPSLARFPPLLSLPTYREPFSIRAWSLKALRATHSASENSYKKVLERFILSKWSYSRHLVKNLVFFYIPKYIAEKENTAMLVFFSNNVCLLDNSH